MTSHRRMPPKRLAKLREDVATGETGFLSKAAVRALLDDRDWHRARVEVTVDDVRRSRITIDQVVAWASATGRYRGLFQGSSEGKPEWAARDAEENGGRQMARYIQSLIRLAATMYHLVQFDVLDEIAATEVAG